MTNKEKAAKWINEQADDTFSLDCKQTGKDVVLLSDAIKAIEMAVPNFIPVNEELPNTEEQVLIKIESGSATYNDRKAVCNFLTAAIDEHGNWYDWKCDENIENTVISCISWLRLSDL